MKNPLASKRKVSPVRELKSTRWGEFFLEKGKIIVGGERKKKNGGSVCQLCLKQQSVQGLEEKK